MLMVSLHGQSIPVRSATTGDRNHVLDALGNVSVEIRNKLGESLSTIQKFDTPLEQATTPSLEALKAYNSSMQTVRTKGPDAATPFFKRAVELDPNFAVAYAYAPLRARPAEDQRRRQPADDHPRGERQGWQGSQLAVEPGAAGDLACLLAMAQATDLPVPLADASRQGAAHHG